MHWPYEMEETMTLRTASIEDLDFLADIACAAFPMDPQWGYRFPHRKRYPRDNWRCTREMYSKVLEDSSVITNVICLKHSADGKEKDHPIALAVWEKPYTTIRAISKGQ